MRPIFSATTAAPPAFPLPRTTVVPIKPVTIVPVVTDRAPVLLTTNNSVAELRHACEPEKLALWDSLVERGLKGTVFTQTMQISPALARLMMAENPDNRRLSTIEVPRLSTIIQQGAWQHNGETIKICRDGCLNDGQNRLAAIAANNQIVTSEVTFGLERDTRETVDTGIPRTVGHVLYMAGFKYTVETATAVKLILQYEVHQNFHPAVHERPSPTAIRQWRSQHPELEKSLSVAQRLYHQLGKGSISKGVMAALHYLFNKVSPQATETFFNHLENGAWEGVHSRDPVFRLREYIHTNGPFNTEAKHIMLAALSIIAFNAMRTGQTMRTLRWRADTDTFPVIVQ